MLKAAIADGNPNIVQSSLIVGFAGHGMVPGRPRDSFGFGVFAFDVSNALQDSIDPLLDFDDEQGLEAWCSLGLTSWFKVSADVQYVNPARGDAEPALLLGLRGNMSF